MVVVRVARPPLLRAAAGAAAVDRVAAATSSMVMMTRRRPHAQAPGILPRRCPVCCGRGRCGYCLVVVVDGMAVVVWLCGIEIVE